jgi:hypothetical protein
MVSPRAVLMPAVERHLSVGRSRDAAARTGGTDMAIDQRMSVERTCALIDSLWRSPSSGSAAMAEV